MSRNNRIAKVTDTRQPKRQKATSNGNTALLDQFEAAFDDVATATKTNSARSKSRRSNRLAELTQEPPLEEIARLDRFGQRYGDVLDPTTRSFPEPQQILARGFLNDLEDLREFRLNVKDTTRHMSQLLRLHENTITQFHSLRDQLQTFLFLLVDAAFEETANRISAFQMAKFADELKERSKQFLALKGNFLPEGEPITRQNFLASPPEEHHRRIHGYFCTACHNLSGEFLRVVSEAVDQTPMGKANSLFSLCRFDDKHGTAVYSYWRTALRGKRSKSSETFPEQEDPFFKQVETTTTKSILHQRKREEHAIVDVEIFPYYDALTAHQLGIPGCIETAMRAAPNGLKSCLSVVAGRMVLQNLVVQDVETRHVDSTVHRNYIMGDQSVSQEWYYDAMLEPALVLFRNWVVAGWNPLEMQQEFQRRGQVRIRQLRSRELADEKDQAQARHLAALQGIAKGRGRNLVASSVTVAFLLLNAAAFFFFNDLPTPAMVFAALAVFIGATAPAQYLTMITRQKLLADHRLQRELKKLDAEDSQMRHEIETLLKAPISELR